MKEKASEHRSLLVLLDAMPEMNFYFATQAAKIIRQLERERDLAREELVQIKKTNEAK